MVGEDDTPAARIETPSPEALRDELERLIVADLLGPVGGEDEQLPGRWPVRDLYLLGMLAPAGTVAVDAARDDDTATYGEESDSGQGDTGNRGPSLFPSSMGLSFAVAPGCDALAVRASWGRYLKESAEADDESGDGPETVPVWQRYPVAASVRVPITSDGALGPLELSADSPGVNIRGRCRTAGNGIRLVTLFLVNEQSPQGTQNRDEWWLFQPELDVTGGDGSAVFVGRRDALGADVGPSDPDEASLDLLYRRRVEFATGHGGATHADVDPQDPWRARRLHTVVAPSHDVARTEAPSPAEVPALAEVTLDMRDLSETTGPDLPAALLPLADAYDTWLDAEGSRIGSADDGLDRDVETARTNLAEARAIAARLRSGIELLGTSSEAAEAFRFANAAMWQQRVHTVAAAQRRDRPELTLGDALRAVDTPENRSWRPFQIAFVCLNVPALVDPHHEERAKPGLVDLLFFPTGGGKTEAYLGLTAFTLAIRRIQGVVSGHDGGDGVAVLMRYTLRLLTAQQFQRATALICACELLRRERVDADDPRWDGTPFRIGMWVGTSVTPNREKYAQQALEELHSGWGAKAKGANPVQLAACPWCGEEIDPSKGHARSDPDRWRTLVFCGDRFGDCPFTEAKSPGEGLPVVTVDESIYRLLPSLVIATADKFAQLPWQGPLHMLFGRVTRRCTRHGFRSPDLDSFGDHDERDRHNKTATLPAAETLDCLPLRPPDLIIQDELHLISGPLGSMVGLAETAVDELCTWDCDGARVRPKVVASTATIRRAQDQAYQIFWRNLAVFPPQVLDAGDSFFARERPVEETPGRRYLGICARGTRLKAVEARVFTTVLAAAQLLADRYGSAADPWMTLVGYFNSLRELGGARRIVDDDVTNRLRRTDRRGLARRTGLLIRELTSRIASTEIPEILDELGIRYEADRDKGDPRNIDVLLATNMISVGVDVSRLGLMVAVGQPKTTAEYIQATSRVGRDRSGPGLVLTIYNWARPRDLSHYEAFEHYHATFYRNVEALSVTPFSPRALDRELTAVLVAMARQLDADWNPNLAADDVDVDDDRMKAIVDRIATRAAEVGDGKRSADLVRDMLQARRDKWAALRAGEAAISYRPAKGQTRPLLEEPTGERWSEWTCPTSLREVEPNVNLVLDDRDEGPGQPPWAPPQAQEASQAPAADTDEDARTSETTDLEEVY
ncbi:MAG: DISARM system helicase DrmA [Acidimicrobiia bacterium]